MNQHFWHGLPGFFNTSLRPGYELLGYVGDRERILAELAKISMPTKILDILIRRTNPLSLLSTAILGLPPLSATNGTRIGQEISELFANERNARTLERLLADHHKKAEKAGRYFKSVGGYDGIIQANQQNLAGRIVTLEGQLLHRATIDQYSSMMATPVLNSESDWVISDFPPPLQTKANERAKGEYLLLEPTEGFSQAVEQKLPFFPDVGWYPDVKITGIFSRANQIAALPALSVGLVEFRPPHPLAGQREHLTEVLTPNTIANRLDLLSTSDKLLASYLGPILFKGSGTTPSDIRDEVALLSALKGYGNQLGQDLPRALTGFYDAC